MNKLEIAKRIGSLDCSFIDWSNDEYVELLNAIRHAESNTLIGLCLHIAYNAGQRDAHIGIAHKARDAQGMAIARIEVATTLLEA